MILLTYQKSCIKDAMDMRLFSVCQSYSLFRIGRYFLYGIVFLTGVEILFRYTDYLKYNGELILTSNHSVSDIEKYVILVFWTLMMGISILFCQKRLASSGKITQAHVFRTGIAAILLLASLVPFYAKRIDLSVYFFVYTVGYLLLFIGLSGFSFYQQPLVWLGRCVRYLLKQPPALWCLSAFAFMFCTSHFISQELFEHFPWIDDTIAQLVHAKMLLHGEWHFPNHPFKEFFRMTYMGNDGGWYSQYPPGHLFMLALGLAIEHPEIVNPLLGASTSGAVYLLGSELYGKRVGRIATLLCALSVYILILSSEYMNHATTLLTGTLFLWAYFVVLHRKSFFFGLLAGAMFGYCFLTRPYTAFGLVLPAAFYAAFLLIKQPRDYFKPMVGMIAMVLVFIGFQLYFNAQTTGDPWVFGYQKCQGGKLNCKGEVPRKWFNPFTADAIERLTNDVFEENFYKNIARMHYFNRVLLEWPLPAMALIALIYLQRGGRRDERLLYATIVSMFISIQFITNKEFGWGPRFLYELNGILLVLIAKALTSIPPLLRRLNPSKEHRPLSYYYGAALALLTSFYIIGFQYNFQKRTISDIYFLDRREGDPAFFKTIVGLVQPPALIFVPEDYYKFVAFTNPPFPDSPYIFARDLGKKNFSLISYYFGRSAYQVMIKKSGKERIRVYRIKEAELP